MKAAVNTTYGPPSVIKISNIPKPSPKENEILLKVHYAGVNRTDDGFLRAKPFVTRFFTGLLKPKYNSLGCEFSGVVEDIGSKVSSYSVGDKVYGFDDKDFGGYADYKTIAVDKMIDKVPKGITLRQAAAATEGAHYAFFYIYKINNISSAKVFLNGATGAIGSAALQLLKARGAYVVASSPTKHIKTVKNLGADEVVDWQKQDISKLNQEFDVFFDAVGKSRFSVARKILKNGGTYMSSELGPWGQNPLLSIINPIQKLFTKRNISFPLPSTRKKEIIEISKVLKSGKFKPLIDREYPLEKIADAFEFVSTGKKTGSVIIKVV
jgi:NADPH:quinone reductase-like Zn-dependent oxidoreductase